MQDGRGERRAEIRRGGRGGQNYMGMSEAWGGEKPLAKLGRPPNLKTATLGERPDRPRDHNGWTGSQRL
eukprot:112632-Hanusia_phi.AAC.1